MNGTNGFQHRIMITKPPQLGVMGNYLNSLHLMKTKLIHMLPANELEAEDDLLW